MASTTVKKHAVYGPSSLKANMLCPGKITMEYGLPDSSGEASMAGTARHFLTAHCLEQAEDAAAYIGQKAVLYRATTGVKQRSTVEVNGKEIAAKEEVYFKEGEGFTPALGTVAFYTEEIDADFAHAVQVCLDIARFYIGEEGTVAPELSVDISEWTGEDGAHGTIDVPIRLPDEIVVLDHKFGYGYVDAVDNAQLKKYALAYWKHLGRPTSVKQARLVIAQPKISEAASEWVISIEDLIAFGEEVKAAAKLAFTALKFRENWLRNPPEQQHYLTPGEVQCQWCKAAKAGICKKLDAQIKDVVGVDFDDLTKESVEEHSRELSDPSLIGEKLRAVPLIETWIAGVRAAAERELMDARNDPELIEKMGFKIVQGKKGNRAWSNVDKAEIWLRRKMGAANCYKPKVLISPTEALKGFEKDVKEVKALEKMIVQADGKPSVAPIDDKRPPVEFPAEEVMFEPVVDELPDEELI